MPLPSFSHRSFSRFTAAFAALLLPGCGGSSGSSGNPGGTPAPTTTYTVTDLGVLPGDEISEASGINATGQVVGTSSSNGYYHAFLVVS